MITGYRDGTYRGRVVILPDECYGKVQENDVQAVADELLAQTGHWPHPSTLRSRLLKLARARAQG